MSGSIVPGTPVHQLFPPRVVIPQRNDPLTSLKPEHNLALGSQQFNTVRTLAGLHYMRVSSGFCAETQTLFLLFSAHNSLDKLVLAAPETGSAAPGWTKMSAFSFFMR